MTVVAADDESVLDNATLSAPDCWALVEALCVAVVVV